MSTTTPLRLADLERLQATVAAISGVDPADMTSDCRHKRVIRARRAFVIVARRRTTRSFPDIAGYVSFARTHSTAVTLFQSATALLVGVGEESRLLAELVDQVDAWWVGQKERTCG